MTSPGQLEANAAMRLLLLTLAAALLEASKLGGGVSRPSIRSDDDKEARIVEARRGNVLGVLYELEDESSSESGSSGEEYREHGRVAPQPRRVQPRRSSAR